MKKINTLYVQFQNEIKNTEIGLFRGAILNKLGDAPILFHNHLGNNYRYSYPLIQYKRIHGKAAIICMKEGTEEIGNLFAATDFCLRIGNRTENMEIASVKAQQTLISLWDSLFTYRLNRWLPLNEENYAKYQELDGIVEQFSFLEKKLTGNILSFAKGLGLHFEDKVTCKIIEAENPYYINYKGVKMMSLNIRFKTNVSLPEYIGLGKGASLGNGIITKWGKKEA